MLPLDLIVMESEPANILIHRIDFSNEEQEAACNAGLRGIEDYKTTPKTILAHEIGLSIFRKHQTGSSTNSKEKFDPTDPDHERAFSAGAKGDFEYEVNSSTVYAHSLGLTAYLSDPLNIAKLQKDQYDPELESRIEGIVAGIQGNYDYVANSRNIEGFRLGIDRYLHLLGFRGVPSAEEFTRESSKFMQEGFFLIFFPIMMSIQQTESLFTIKYWKFYNEALNEYDLSFREGIISERDYTDFIMGSITALNYSVSILDEWMKKPNHLVHVDPQSGSAYIFEVLDLASINMISVHRANLYDEINSIRTDLHWRLENPSIYVFQPGLTVVERGRLERFRREGIK